MQNATEELTRLEEAFNVVRQGIFTRLHEVVRDQIFLTSGTKEIPSKNGASESVSGEEPEASRSNGSALQKANAQSVGQESSAASRV